LLSANKRLNTAYVLKGSFGQLWSYEREGWARRFFENWRGSLKWQRLKPYEKFAEMIDRHWDGIAAYRQPENKVSLGFVEGLNNKIIAIFAFFFRYFFRLLYRARFKTANSVIAVTAARRTLRHNCIVKARSQCSRSRYYASTDNIGWS
jgi:hypothetical protein